MENEKITLAHGAGGSLSQALMESVILPAFGNEFLQKMHDGAALDLGGKTAFTTDSFIECKMRLSSSMESPSSKIKAHEM